MHEVNEIDLPADATRDRLIGDWWLYQRKRGHRTSTDDVLTAWLSQERCHGAPRSYLDLGCGIGSVLLMVCHRLRPERALGIEVQEQSALMARRSVAELPAGAPAIRIERADFRDYDFAGTTFDLVSASPPYFPLSDGVLPADPQRRGCRFEVNGGVEDYCQVAARVLAPGGRLCVVFQTTWDERVLGSAEAAALQLRARADISMRKDRDAPFLTVYEFRREAGAVDQYAFSIRDESGAITADYARARAQLGV